MPSETRQLLLHTHTQTTTPDSRAQERTTADECLAKRTTTTAGNNQSIPQLILRQHPSEKGSATSQAKNYQTSLAIITAWRPPNSPPKHRERERVNLKPTDRNARNKHQTGAIRHTRNTPAQFEPDRDTFGKWSPKVPLPIYTVEGPVTPCGGVK